MPAINPRRTRLAVLLTAATFAVVSACTDHRVPPQPRPAGVFYGLTSSNQLLTLNTQSSETASATVSITGLQGGENLLAIDFRPATGQLYGVGSSSRIYVINPATGLARAIGTGAFTPAINGSVAGFDFNPTVDRIRLVTNTGQNLRLNPETGAVMITDGSINGGVGGTPAIGAVAYTNSFAGASTTVLYDIDPVTDRLYKQDPPNNGTLVDVGPLGLPITNVGGFDISPDNSGAIASVEFNGAWELDYIDLATGKAQKLGDLPAGNVIGIAIPTNPVAYAVSESNSLLIFNPTNVGMPASRAITGLAAGENILGIDFRPLNGQLYALGSTSRLYTINASSGAATVVGSAGAFTLTGSDFGFDFNPTVDRIRVVSNTGQNLRLNPNDGALAATDGALNPGSPSVTAAAYTNNFVPVTPPGSTVLYVIDSNTDKLFRQMPPNDGTLVEVGPLGINAEAGNGFDIGGTSGTAYLLAKFSLTSSIYTVNLNTGATTKVADFPMNVRGMAVGLGF
ncbi:MAG: DUF4394 domain-containing protein [Sphingobacteriaceae bacterium]|nr:DUF4394 domain-containing protein [Cytophagaceae bacterium]